MKNAKTLFQYVKPEGWDLTVEQISLIMRINAEKLLMRKAFNSVVFCAILFVAFTLGMICLQEDQVFIYEAYRMMLMASVGWGFQQLLTFSRHYSQFISVYTELMRTDPALPGAPHYAKPATETENVK